MNFCHLLMLVLWEIITLTLNVFLPYSSLFRATNFKIFFFIILLILFCILLLPRIVGSSCWVCAIFFYFFSTFFLLIILFFFMRFSSSSFCNFFSPFFIVQFFHEEKNCSCVWWEARSERNNSKQWIYTTREITEASQHKNLSPRVPQTILVSLGYT